MSTLNERLTSALEKGVFKIPEAVLEVLEGLVSSKRGKFEAKVFWWSIFLLDYPTVLIETFLEVLESLFKSSTMKLI